MPSCLTRSPELAREHGRHRLVGATPTHAGEPPEAPGVGTTREDIAARLEAFERLSRDGFTILEAIRDESGHVADFVRIYANERAAELIRRPLAEIVGRRLLQVLPGIRITSRLFDRYVHVTETGEPLDIEYYYEADGIERWFHNRSIRFGDGVAVVFFDITERKRAEERQALLVAELEHRIKNAFALAQAISRHLVRDAPTVPAFQAALEHRLRALANVHGLLVGRGARGGQLEAVIRTTCKPYADDDRLHVAVPAMALEDRAAVSLALVLNELVSNAVKYGALSTPAGSLAVNGRVLQADGADLLQLDWAETGGPPVQAPPAAAGFGMTMMRRLVEDQHLGRLELKWRPEGLCCCMELPLGTIVATGEDHER
jgi:two-component sensor histidine kinase